ncbi:kinase-like domain-containing protein [Syncephalis fuscata]|nr:kinase-like domain-containing protein [Syncephalis fuscata]
MIFSQKHLGIFSISAFIVISTACFAAATPLGSVANSDTIVATRFLSQSLDRENAFGQPGLKIEQVIIKNRIMNLAKSTYTDENAVTRQTITKCTNYKVDDARANRQSKFTINTESNAFKAKTKLKGPLASGRQFVVRSFLKFDYNNNYCFVLSNGGDENLMTYTQDMDLATKAKVLPRYSHKFYEVRAAYLHRARLVHNDIKPENIAINTTYVKYPRAKLIDFDVTTPLEYIKKNKVALVLNTISGTPLYMAPEVYVPNLPFDPRKKDTWAIGASFYRVLFGRGLFEGVSRSILKLKITNVRQKGLDPLLFDIDADPTTKTALEPLISMIKTLLAPRFEDRPTPEEYLDIHYPGPLKNTIHVS